MKIKLKIEYNLQVNLGFEWSDLLENSFANGPIKKFYKGVEFEADDEIGINNSINKIIEDLTVSFKGTHKRIKNINFSYTRN